MERVAFLKGSMNQELKQREKLDEIVGSLPVTVIYSIVAHKSLKIRFLIRTYA